jgi:hypothetical protein
MTPEDLIRQLQDQVIKLESELFIAQQDIKDFEVLAVEWKKGHEKLKIKHTIEVANLRQEIEELKVELKNS